MSGLVVDPTPRGRRHASLVATGIVMVAAVFLYANPYFGSKAARWPWEHFAESSSLSRKADLLLWVATALVAIAVGLGRGGPRRLAWLGAPVLLLVARCYGESAAFTAVQPNEPTLAWFVSAACVGASLLVLSTRDERGRGVARAMGVLGAVGLAAAYAITFRGERSVVWHFRQDYANAWEKLFGGSETDPEHVQKMWSAWWGALFPMALLVLASATATVLSAVRTSSAATRWAARIAWVLLLGRWVAPVLATAWMERDRLTGGSAPSTAAEWAGRTVFDAGLGLWLVASCTLAVLVRETAPGPRSLGATGAPAGAST